MGIDRPRQPSIFIQQEREREREEAVTLKDMSGSGRGMKLHHIMHHARAALLEMMREEEKEGMSVMRYHPCPVP